MKRNTKDFGDARKAVAFAKKELAKQGREYISGKRKKINISLYGI